jgi:hypothetical protein
LKQLLRLTLKKLKLVRLTGQQLKLLLMLMGVV